MVCLGDSEEGFAATGLFKASSQEVTKVSSPLASALKAASYQQPGAVLLWSGMSLCPRVIWWVVWWLDCGVWWSDCGGRLQVGGGEVAEQ